MPKITDRMPSGTPMRTANREPTAPASVGVVYLIFRPDPAFQLPKLDEAIGPGLRQLGQQDAGEFTGQGQHAALGPVRPVLSQNV